MKHLPYLLMLLFVAACSSIDCPVNNTVATYYQVRSITGDSLVLSDTLTVSSARLDGSDTILLNKNIGRASFSLPISYSHPEDILIFQFDNDSVHVKDTVWVKKDDYPHFESVDCNSVFFHTLTDVRHTQNYIDSIVIKDPSVTFNYATIHFYLYPKIDD